MLDSLRLENYRCFPTYRLSSLSRVNLIVGKNNCGKTSVLEAVHLLAAGGDPRVLLGTAVERGEVVVAEDETERPGRTRVWPVVSHFFHGHESGAGSSFSIMGHGTVRRHREASLFDSGMPGVVVRIVSGAELPRTGRRFEEREALRPGLALVIEGEEGPVPIPVTEDGAVRYDLLYPYYGPAVKPDRNVPGASRFITCESLDARQLGELWDTVITEGLEDEALRAMQILEPDLEGIYFLSSKVAYASAAGPAGILVATKGSRRRSPLGSYGDGMRRLLALSISLIRAREGYLCVDEIDTGLHYSVMADMWRLVIGAARQFGVQVFATTHSFDCVRGLAWLCERRPELRL
jgi:hypothetical protein